MRTRLLQCLLLLLLAWLASPAPAFAGQQCREKPITAAELRTAVHLAWRIATTLEQTRAEAALIARAGSDLSKHGLRYSHVGLLTREPAGFYRITHLLNHCGEASSALYEERLANFFLDDPYLLEALVVTPSREMQRRLKAAIASPLPNLLHHARYNMLANPRAPQYQNSNQWVAEMLAASLEPYMLRGREDARQLAIARGFAGDPIAVDAMSRLGAQFTRNNVHFDDRTLASRQSGLFEVATVRSVILFLKRLDRIESEFVLLPDGRLLHPSRY